MLITLLLPSLCCVSEREDERVREKGERERGKERELKRRRERERKWLLQQNNKRRQEIFSFLPPSFINFHFLLFSLSLWFILFNSKSVPSNLNPFERRRKRRENMTINYYNSFSSKLMIITSHTFSPTFSLLFPPFPSLSPSLRCISQDVWGKEEKQMERIGRRKSESEKERRIKREREEDRTRERRDERGRRRRIVSIIITIIMMMITLHEGGESKRKRGLIIIFFGSMRWVGWSSLYYNNNQVQIIFSLLRGEGEEVWVSRL